MHYWEGVGNELINYHKQNAMLRNSTKFLLYAKEILALTVYLTRIRYHMR